MTASRQLMLAILIIAVSTLYFTGCATTAVSRDLKPLNNPPNLVGTWNGVWGGTMHGASVSESISVTVESQQADQVKGTATLRSGNPIPMTGVVGAKEDGGTWAVMDIGDARTSISFDLKVVSQKRLEGTGHSARHVGPVHLNRE